MLRITQFSANAEEMASASQQQLSQTEQLNSIVKELFGFVGKRGEAEKKTGQLIAS
jgi:methyl-accepting chemotaxis protein